MKNISKIFTGFLIFCLVSALSGFGQSTLPYLKKQGDATQLIVKGKPFLMLAGELHNSSCSSLEYMAPIWPRMAAKNLNTVIAPASWELVEPTEGQYDFTMVDAILDGAKKSNLKIVLIWFASWKNGGSIYMPSWVKKDYKRFPRAVDQQGNPLEILSTLGEESMKADAKAFAALMRHIKEVDKDQTILMVQVENEVGILNSVRDFSPAADKAYFGQVPEDLINYLTKNKTNLIPELYEVWSKNGFKTKGNWEEVFGKSFVDVKNWKAYSFYTEEIFMAYHYAKYIGYVTAEGKKEYNIPMFCNAWLKQPDYPWTGRFPGGGPLPEVMDIWRAAGPAIDFLAPDIYYSDFRWVMEQFDRSGNPMFIPETSGGASGASKMLYALGEHNIMGFSPFGIDGSNQMIAGPAASDPLAETYALVEGMSDLILEHQGKGSIRGILVDNEVPYQEFEMGDYIVMADPMSSGRPASAQQGQGMQQQNISGGFIIQLGKDEYVVLGRDLNVRFKPKNPGDLPYIGIDAVDEGVYKDGKWAPGRRLNGDETHCSTFSGTGLKMRGMSIQKISLYRYK